MKEQKTAFPRTPYVLEHAAQKPYGGQAGMSKRFYAACAAMQGILSSGMDYSDPRLVIRAAYEYADELLKQEENKK